jgi:hypothetical protein
MEPLVISFEEFKTRYDIPTCVDHGRLAFPHGCNGAQARRNTAYLDEHFAEKHRKEALAWADYNRMLAAGEIREPTHLEHLLDVCAGHPDNASVQASRRLLKKHYGIDWVDR